MPVGRRVRSSSGRKVSQNRRRSFSAACRYLRNGEATSTPSGSFRSSPHDGHVRRHPSSWLRRIGLQSEKAGPQRIHGERLLEAEAERGKWTWASPVDIARLLLMRRVPKPPPDEGEFWRFRVLGAIIPEFDALVAAKPASLPTSGTPILPLYLRPALLAGVAIVYRAGPGMLAMLRGHTIGDNRARFGELAERAIAHARKPRPFLQWQLI